MKMLMLLFIVVLFTVGDVTSVSDEEFQELKDLLDQQGALLNRQIIRTSQQDQVIFDQAVEITQLKQALGLSPKDSDKKVSPIENSYFKGYPATFQIITLEERVSLLELQMTEAQDDIDAIEEDKIDVEQDVDFLEDEQFLLDQTINNLEENVYHVAQDVLGLQSSDTALEARVTALEINKGGGASNETSIAFFAVYPDISITFPSNVIFNEVLINDGEGFKPSTGTFTVPSGGDGLYYFSTYLVVSYDESAYFNIYVNGAPLCTAYGYGFTGGVYQQATCSGLAQLREGDEVSLVYDSGTDTTPLVVSASKHYNGFSGFRL